MIQGMTRKLELMDEARYAKVRLFHESRTLLCAILRDGKSQTEGELSILHSDIVPF